MSVLQRDITICDADGWDKDGGGNIIEWCGQSVGRVFLNELDGFPKYALTMMGKFVGFYPTDKQIIRAAREYLKPRIPS